MFRQVTARAPTRIDFGGGWTDVPPYCDLEGGFVCNVAIDRWASVRVCEASPTAAAIIGADRTADHSLADAALRRSGVTGVDILVANEFPVGAGLGGSSAAGVAAVAALGAWRGEMLAPGDVAERSRAVEVEDLGIPGGRQDHYAAVLGGLLGLRFTDTVEVERIELSSALRRELERRCILVYTGQSRLSGHTITAVLDAYRARDARVVFALKRMKELAEEMAGALRSEDVDALAAFVGEHWAHQRSLHPAIPTARIDAIIHAAHLAGGGGAKALGASGGGTVLVIAARESVDELRAAVKPLGSILEFTLAEEGLQVRR